MGQLPHLMEQTSELKKRSDFAVFTVSFDNPDRQAEVDRVIREYGIDHTVIWDHRDTGDLSNKGDWNIKGFPTTVLINPDGVIQASMDVDEHLEENLLYFLEQDSVPPPIGLDIKVETDDEGKAMVNDDGNVMLNVDVYSPTHAPLEVIVDASGTIVTYDEENDPDHESPEYETIDYREEGLIPELTFSFDDYGNASRQVPLKAFDNMSYIFVVVSIKLPGTDALNGGEGLSTSTFSFVRLPAQE